MLAFIDPMFVLSILNFPLVGTVTVSQMSFPKNKPQLGFGATEIPSEVAPTVEYVTGLHEVPTATGIAM
jgi:hypothetical protein